MKTKEFILGNHLFYTEEEINKIKDTNLNVKRALGAMEEYAGQSIWIPVEERLPDQSEYVLVCDRDGDVFKGHYSSKGNRWWQAGDDGDIIYFATHWQPLPEGIVTKNENSL